MNLNLQKLKQKKWLKFLANINADKALIVMDGANTNVMLSARNIPDVKTAAVSTINVYDILKIQHTCSYKRCSCKN